MLGIPLGEVWQLNTPGFLWFLWCGPSEPFLPVVWGHTDSGLGHVRRSLMSVCSVGLVLLTLTRAMVLLEPAPLQWEAQSRHGKRPTGGEPGAQPSLLSLSSQPVASTRLQSCEGAFLKVDPPHPVKRPLSSPAAQISNHDQISDCIVLCLLSLRMVCHVAIDNQNRKQTQTFSI